MSTPQELKQRQRGDWNTAAAGWQKWDAWLERASQPVTAWLCEAAGASAGMHVLDLASGTGQPALTLAGRVQPAGSVTGVDLSSEMLAVANQRSHARGISNLTLREADIENLDFADASFDAATCRWGLMFCPDPSAAIAEVNRILRPGARFATVTWDAPAKNPFFTLLTQILPRFTTMPQPDPGAPGPFRLADIDELRRYFQEAGFRDIQAESSPMQMPFSSAEEYWQCATDLGAPFRALLASLDEANTAELKSAVLEAAAGFQTQSGTVSFPGAYIRVSAAK